MICPCALSVVSWCFCVASETEVVPNLVQRDTFSSKLWAVFPATVTEFSVCSFECLLSAFVEVFLPTVEEEGGM